MTQHTSRPAHVVAHLAVLGASAALHAVRRTDDLTRPLGRTCCPGGACQGACSEPLEPADT